MEQQNEIHVVIQELQACGLPATEHVVSYNNLVNALSNYINDLITKDFSNLVNLLYRLDVSEDKVRTLIKEETHQPASISIAKLIIERQLQKIRQRTSFKSTDNIPEDEKW